MHRAIRIIAAIALLSILAACVGPAEFIRQDGTRQTSGAGSSAVSIDHAGADGADLSAVLTMAKDLHAEDITIRTPSGYEFSAKRWDSGSANGTRGVEAVAHVAEQAHEVGTFLLGRQQVIQDRKTRQEVRKEAREEARKAQALAQAEEFKLKAIQEEIRLIAAREREAARLAAEAAAHHEVAE